MFQYYWEVYYLFLFLPFWEATPFAPFPCFLSLSPFFVCCLFFFAKVFCFLQWFFCFSSIVFVQLGCISITIGGTQRFFCRILIVCVYLLLNKIFKVPFINDIRLIEHIKYFLCHIFCGIFLVGSSACVEHTLIIDAVLYSAY